jgi:tRNA threonylcarbamoyladenosine biosynthesis protein TsaB
MLILALDTTTRAGSLSIVRDQSPLETFVGDAARTHATRLPGDIIECLDRHGLALSDLDLYGVAAGPGSFTGLRIGIATIQGLAFAHGRLVVGVSALDALVEAAGTAGTEAGATGILGAWMDAQRGEVYACLYRLASGRWTAVTPPLVQRPEAVLAAWVPLLDGSPAAFVGDGALTYREVLEQALGASACVIRPVPPLAPAIARIAAVEAAAGRAVQPHGVRPIYIRRPDAELARDRRAGGAR